MKLSSTLLLVLLLSSFSVLAQFKPILVQVINNVPDPEAGNMTVTIAGKLIGTTQGYKFREATPAFDVTPFTDYMKVSFKNISFEMNFAPGGNEIIIYDGVTTSTNYNNPYTRNIKLSGTSIKPAEMIGFDNKITFSIIHNTTDAPKVIITDKGSGELWAENIDYRKNTDYPYLPDKEAKVYNLEVKSGEDGTVIGDYTADLTNYADKSLFIFTSGFLEPAKNKNGSEFGIFAALSDGKVIEFKRANSQTLPLEPELLSPANSSTEIPIKGCLKWKTKPNETYTVQIGTDDKFGSIVFQSNKITADSIIFDGLIGETWHYWHVRADNASGTGPWSKTRTFKTVKTTGIADDKKDYDQRLFVYPNPVSDYIILKNTSCDQGRIRIITIEGNTVIESEYKDRIDISTLPDGIYFLMAGSRIMKFTKK